VDAGVSNLAVLAGARPVLHQGELVRANKLFGGSRLIVPTWLRPTRDGLRLAPRDSTKKEISMATKQAKRRHSKGASKKVEKTMHERKQGTLRSGSSEKKVTSRKQAIAIGLSEARREGEKVPKRSSSRG
jgi:hypothetical protein